MDFNTILYNIETIQCVVFIADSNLNLIAKNNFAQLSNIKTRLGAYLGHYISQSDICKIQKLKNNECTIVDF